MKTTMYESSKESISANEVMTVIITDSENVKREYGVKAIDVVDNNFANQQIKEHKEVYETEVKVIDVLTYEGKKFKTITF